MPPLDLTDDEHAEIVRLLRATIEADRFPLSPRIKRLKAVLATLDPPAPFARPEGARLSVACPFAPHDPAPRNPTPLASSRIAGKNGTPASISIMSSHARAVARTERLARLPHPARPMLSMRSLFCPGDPGSPEDAQQRALALQILQNAEGLAAWAVPDFMAAVPRVADVSATVFLQEPAQLPIGHRGHREAQVYVIVKSG